MKSRYFLFCIWLLLTGLATTAHAQQGTLKEIAPGVWFREGEWGTGHCNNVIIEMNDYLVVVDANYPSGAHAVLADVPKVSAKPIKYVIDTHHHPDHAYGNAVFTRAGAITIGHIGVFEEMNRYEPMSWRGVARIRKDVAELNLPAVEAAVKRGEKLDQVVTMNGNRPVATTIQLPKSIDDVYVFHGPDLKPWQISRFPTQVMATYREISEGKPYGEILGGK